VDPRIGVAGAKPPGTELSVRIETDAAGIPVVYVSGELDSSNLDGFRQAIDPVISPAPERVVFELTELRFLDSAAIALLVELATGPCPVEVRNPTRIVRKVIAITGLTELLHLAS